VIGTGSRVKSLPGIVPDGHRIITSDDVTTKADLPKSIAIVGRRRGRLRVRLSVPRPGRQRHACSNTCRRSSRSRTVTSVPALERSFTRRGIKIVTKARFDAASVKVTADGVSMLVGPDGGVSEELRVEQLLMATGRAPNTEGIGLETTKSSSSAGT